MRRIVMIAMTCMLTSAAAAQGPIGMPDYDVERHCKRQASMFGGGDFWLNACLVQEQDAYDQLKARWSEIWADPSVMRRCRQQSSMFGASYFWLNACVVQELEAREEVSKFKFRK
jgi:hypothetical protein